MGNNVKTGMDVAAYSNALATLAGLLPPTAAALTIVWLSIQITEKLTGKPFVEVVKCFLNRFKRKD